MRNFLLKIILPLLFIQTLQTGFIHGQNDKEDEEIIALLNEGTDYFVLGNPGALQIAFEKFTFVLEICEKRKIKECELPALNYLGQIYLRKGDNEKALDFLERAFEIFQQIPANERLNDLEHQILFGLGNIYLNSGKSSEALEKFQKLLDLTKKRNDSFLRAMALFNIGNVHKYLKQKNSALEKYQEALRIIREEIRKFPNVPLLIQTEIVYLTETAGLFQQFGEISESLVYFQQILEIHKGRNDLISAAMTLNIMHIIAVTNGKADIALKYMDEAVAICQKLNNLELESFILSYAVSTNFSEGEWTKAIEYSKKVLIINQKLNNVTGQANSLAYIAGIYLNLGSNFEAIDYYERALPLYKSQGCKESEKRFSPDSGFCRQGEMVAVTGIGKAYSNIGKKEEALQILEKELAKGEAEGVFKKTAFEQYKGILHNVIGQIYFELGQNEKAIKYFTEALPIINKKNIKRQAEILTDIGKVQAVAENKTQAVNSFNQALLFLTPFVKKLKKGNEEVVGYTLTNLMTFYRLENPKAAIFYGKKAIDAYQKNRDNFKKLDRETQKNYLKSVEFSYRTLAEILLAQKRDSEAQQVINSFKDQQFFDPVQTENSEVKFLTQTPREKQLFAAFELLSEKIARVENQIDEFQRRIKNRQPTVQEQAELQNLENELKTESDNFKSAFRKTETEFAKPPDEQDEVGNIQDTTELQETLREIEKQTKQKPVAVYQLIGEENFSVIIISADAIKSVSTPFKNSDLNEKAKEFWALIQSDVYDPTIIGKELYDTIFKPFEKELPANTKTILWSLDQNLRYVPMAALFDGENYLVKRYNHVNFTRANKERMLRNVTPDWKGIGFGSTKAQTVTLQDEPFSFDKLPGVEQELKEIFKTENDRTGIIDGNVLQDLQFNQKNMLDELKLKRPLVHISSHFLFRPGDESLSFLLMGDGTAFTLADMKKQGDLFAGVELLTLSACNTAAQQSDASGKEIDGFAELAQRLGASSVMATLWQVSDNSTPWLMRDFYSTRKNSKGITKSEALQKAQIGLLDGTAKIKPLPKTQKSENSENKIKIEIVPNGTKIERSNTNRGGPETFTLEAKKAPLYTEDKSKPFAHPYYWSPFVLYGNWK